MAMNENYVSDLWVRASPGLRGGTRMWGMPVSSYCGIRTNRRRFGQHQVAVDQYRHFAAGTDVAERRLARFAFVEIDQHEFVRQIRLFQRPQSTRGAGAPVARSSRRSAVRRRTYSAKSASASRVTRDRVRSSSTVAMRPTLPLRSRTPSSDRFSIISSPSLRISIDAASMTRPSMRVRARM